MKARTQVKLLALALVAAPTLLLSQAQAAAEWAEPTPVSYATSIVKQVSHVTDIPVYTNDVSWDAIIPTYLICSRPNFSALNAQIKATAETYRFTKFHTNTLYRYESSSHGTPQKSSIIQFWCTGDLISAYVKSVK